MTEQTPIERAAQSIKEEIGAYACGDSYMTEGGLRGDEHFTDIVRADVDVLPDGLTYGPELNRSYLVFAKWWQRCGKFERIGRYRYKRIYGKFRAINDEEGGVYDMVRVAEVEK